MKSSGNFLWRHSLQNFWGSLFHCAFPKDFCSIKTIDLLCFDLLCWVLHKLSLVINICQLKWTEWNGIKEWDWRSRVLYFPHERGDLDYFIQFSWKDSCIHEFLVSSVTHHIIPYPGQCSKGLSVVSSKSLPYRHIRLEIHSYHPLLPTLSIMISGLWGKKKIKYLSLH